MNAISELSTEWCLPSKHVTRTSTTGKPERPAGLLGFGDTLFDCGNEVARDHAADDRVDELVAGAALLRLDAQPRHRELPVAAALLLELALGLGGAGDRLPVGDAHFVGVDLDAELARQLLERDRDVGLAHAVQHGLVRLGVAVDANDGIFFLQLVQRVGELVLVGLVLGADCDREQRLGRREHVDLERRALRGEHVAGTGRRQLGDGGDVAGRHLVDRVLLLAPHREQLVHALVALGARVGEHFVVLHRALQHLEEVHVADVRVDDRLEHERGGCAVVRSRCGRLLDNERGEPVDADEVRRAAAQHREHGCRRDARGQRLGQFAVFDLLVAEVTLHQVVVADDDALDQGVVHRVFFVRHVVGNRAFAALRVALGVRHRGVVQQFDDTVERGFLADRELQRRDTGAELLL